MEAFRTAPRLGFFPALRSERRDVGNRWKRSRRRKCAGPRVRNGQPGLTGIDAGGVRDEAPAVPATENAEPNRLAPEGCPSQDGRCDRQNDCDGGTRMSRDTRGFMDTSETDCGASTAPFGRPSGRPHEVLTGSFLARFPTGTRARCYGQ